MSGTVKKRGENSWQICVYNGKDPATARSKYIRETFKGTEKDAVKRMRQIEVERDKDEYIEPSKMTFSEFLDSWLEHEESQVTAGTFEDYQTIVKKHIQKSTIAKIKMDKLEPFHIQQYITAKTKSKRLDNKPGNLSPKTIKNHLGVIKKALKQARIWKIIKTNPADDISAPKVPKYRAQTFSTEEVGSFLRAAETNRFYLFFLLAIYTGMREGELRGMRWKDLDLKKCFISIKQIVRKNGKSVIFKEPKTESSAAKVSFDSWMVPLFEEHRKKQVAERLEFGPGFKDHDLVFCSQDGWPVNLNIMRKHFENTIKTAQVPEIRFHDLRHSCATILLEHGVNVKTVQERLRHADIRTTLNTYSHVTAPMQRQADDIMNLVTK